MVTSLEMVLPDLARLALGYVNVYLVGGPGGWVLVDTGERDHVESIRAAAQQFAGDSPPQAIVLTHGHFDHAGSARALAQRWDVPIYASRYELPFLRGELRYPAPDPQVGGFYGWLANFVTMPACEPHDDIRELPADLATIGLAGWTCVATPGHTPGHISLFHRGERALLAGDACLTVDFQSWIGGITGWPRVSAPPAPYTLDWEAARRSVQALAALRPQLIASGHGRPIRGERAARELDRLARNFAPPRHGRHLEPTTPWTAPIPGQMPCSGAEGGG